MNNMRTWTIRILVFWGIFKILFFLLKNIPFYSLGIVDPYLNILEIVGSFLVVLLSFIFTALLLYGNGDK
ncbi:hypothetical protein ACK8P5_25020 [Paenibacillus sp. EC2-1]|uniref:hypothetical protein n=1 Tax=Paenibacillus sp. EC2-1 TaxID=3388665 RepID=UPI003BEEB8E6